MLSSNQLLAAVVLTVAFATPAIACDAREPTRETGPGPHDFTTAPTTSKLWAESDGGEPLFFRARVVDHCGKPIQGAKVRVLHANKDGGHELDRWRTHLETDQKGTFKLLTVFPGYTGGIPRHIHFIVEHPEHPRLVTRLFFKNDPSVDHGIEDLAMVLEEIQRDGKKGWLASYEFILRPGGAKN